MFKSYSVLVITVTLLLAACFPVQADLIFYDEVRIGDSTSSYDEVVPGSDPTTLQLPQPEAGESGFSISTGAEPFNSATTVNYSINTSGHVQISAYNQQGHVVRTLVNEQKPMGNHKIHWNGADKYGRPLAVGVYILKILSGGKTLQAPVVLVK